MKYSLLAILVLGCSSTEAVEQTTALGTQTEELCDVECGTDTCKEGRLICHVPPGNPAQAHELCVSSRAVVHHFREHDGDTCGECGPVCGDEVCDLELENCENCSLDCGFCGPQCGNQECEEGENCRDCPADCGECEPFCGDGVCNGNETCGECVEDCGECIPFCGDGICQEDCTTCDNDCGLCPDAGVPPQDPPTTDPEPNLTVEGGGCSVSSPTSGGAWMLGCVLLGLALIVRKRNFKLFTLLTVTALFCVMAGRAMAQDFDTERFQPGMDESAILNVESGETKPEGAWGLQTWVNVSDDVLVLKDVDLDETVNDLVDLRVAGGFGGFYAISDSLQLGISLPISWAQWTPDTLQGDVEFEVAMGDLTFAPKVGLTKDWFKLALIPVFSVPTASNDRGFGNDGLGFSPTVAMSGTYSMWRANLNLGYSFKEDTRLLDLRVDDELFAKAGLAYGWGAGTELELAVSAAVEADNPFDHGNRNYVEAMVGYQRFLRPGLSMFAGAGRSLADGYGGPDWRALGGLRYSYENAFGNVPCGALGGPGCPKDPPVVLTPPVVEEPPAPEREVINVVIPNTFFAFDRSVVKDSYKALLETFAKQTMEVVTKKDASIRIVLTGSTDKVGKKTYNKELGFKRAQAVAKILMDNGVPADVIELVSVGEDNPNRGDDATTKGRADNRNVIITYGYQCSGDICVSADADVQYLGNEATEETFDNLGSLE